MLVSRVQDMRIQKRNYDALDRHVRYFQEDEGVNKIKDVLRFVFV